MDEPDVPTGNEEEQKLLQERHTCFYTYYTIKSVSISASHLAHSLRMLYVWALNASEPELETQARCWIHTVKHNTSAWTQRLYEAQPGRGLTNSPPGGPHAPAILYPAYVRKKVGEFVQFVKLIDEANTNKDWTKFKWGIHDTLEHAERWLAELEEDLENEAIGKEMLANEAHVKKALANQDE
jgi:hypothetical protein